MDPLEAQNTYEIVIKDSLGQELRKHSAHILSDDQLNKIIVIRWDPDELSDEKNESIIGSETLLEQSISDSSHCTTVNTVDLLNDVLQSSENECDIVQPRLRITRHSLTTKSSDNSSKEGEQSVKQHSTNDKNCKFCSKKFKSSSAARRHEKEKHDSDTEAKSCSDCHRRFTRNYLYRRHSCKKIL